MKKILVIALLSASVLIASGDDRRAIRCLGTYGEKTLLTKLKHQELRKSSPWKLGNGEPPIGPGKAAKLAIGAQKIHFPDLQAQFVTEVTLVSKPGGCFYRVQIREGFAPNVGEMPNSMHFFVLLNSKVIVPKEKD